MTLAESRKETRELAAVIVMAAKIAPKLFGAERAIDLSRAMLARDAKTSEGKP